LSNKVPADKAIFINTVALKGIVTLALWVFFLIAAAQENTPDRPTAYTDNFRLKWVAQGDSFHLKALSESYAPIELVIVDRASDYIKLHLCILTNGRRLESFQ
jgi:hypothetical protein